MGLSLIGERFLFFAAGISQHQHLYHSLGNDVILPCDNVTSSETRCFLFNWLYNPSLGSVTTFKVNKGKVYQNPPGGSRLSLSNNCSLIISTITAEDVGRYTCRRDQAPDTIVHLNILTISPSPADTDPETDNEVTLTCSLWRYDTKRPCPQNSILWVDEEGTVLTGEGDGYKFNGQTDCVSHLTVKRQSNHNRRYTCQFIGANSVKIDAHYSPVYTDPPTSYVSYIMLSLRVTTLVLMIGITVAVITNRGNSHHNRTS
ncbi:uncharacterized protein LOC103374038 [Stegastes partitus]|uniref:Uncharacterized protein LOC103374038 n=1 Tax=Stegastes partitus TaxID=144197 RepID=A0A9Y4NRN3_9TELE|nr:PREDICTED: uncharacterized protein LOC103374038 [Stegastes partitus]